MRTDLIGGEDILAKVEALTEQQQAAQVARSDAEAAVKVAKRADLEDAAEALRAGAAAPKPTEPAAQKTLDNANRNFEIVTLALKTERSAWTDDLAVRDKDIRMKLAEAEDACNEALAALVTEAEAVLAERDEIQAYGRWLDDTSRNLSLRRVGADPLTGLRKAINPAVQVNSVQERRDYEARIDAWNAFVNRVAATVPMDRRVPMLDATSDSGQTTPAIDAAIEREIDRMTEAGEEVPVPVTKKWMQRLGTTAKPKGKGTGWSPLSRPVPTDMPPDTESAEGRRLDINKRKATHGN